MSRLRKDGLPDGRTREGKMLKWASGLALAIYGEHLPTIHSNRDKLEGNEKPLATELRTIAQAGLDG